MGGCPTHQGHVGSLTSAPTTPPRRPDALYLRDPIDRRRRTMFGLVSEYPADHRHRRRRDRSIRSLRPRHPGPDVLFSVARPRGSARWTAPVDGAKRGAPRCEFEVSSSTWARRRARRPWRAASSHGARLSAALDEAIRTTRGPFVIDLSNVGFLTRAGSRASCALGRSWAARIVSWASSAARQHAPRARAERGRRARRALRLARRARRLAAAYGVDPHTCGSWSEALSWYSALMCTTGTARRRGHASRGCGRAPARRREHVGGTAGPRAAWRSGR
jgi:hypothetical protein